MLRNNLKIFHLKEPKLDNKSPDAGQSEPTNLTQGVIS